MPLPTSLLNNVEHVLLGIEILRVRTMPKSSVTDPWSLAAFTIATVPYVGHQVLMHLIFENPKSARHLLSISQGDINKNSLKVYLKSPQLWTKESYQIAGACMRLCPEDDRELIIQDDNTIRE